MTGNSLYQAFTASLALIVLANPAMGDDDGGSFRRTDLNDYAIGVKVSADQNPYVGGQTSTVVYPYLTSLDHPALTKDWLYFQDSNLGIRYVSDSEWEAGAVIRMQTRGFGSDNEAAEQLFDRRWTAEAGPKVARLGGQSESRASYWLPDNAALAALL